MRRSLVLGVAVLAAMTLGRVVTDQVPLGAVATKPFVRAGQVGHVLSLRYADVEVTGVRSAAFLGTPSGAAAPSGRFLAVDATVVAKQQPQQLRFVALLGGDGRTYAPTMRGSCTSGAPRYPTGIGYHVMFCFDVPRQALAASRLEVSHGEPGQGGGQARDDVGRVDLGISPTDAARLWATTTGYDGFVGGFDRPDLKPLTLKATS